MMMQSSSDTARPAAMKSEIWLCEYLLRMNVRKSKVLSLQQQGQELHALLVRLPCTAIAPSPRWYSSAGSSEGAAAN